MKVKRSSGAKHYAKASGMKDTNPFIWGACGLLPHANLPMLTLISVPRRFIGGIGLEGRNCHDKRDPMMNKLWGVFIMYPH